MDHRVQTRNIRIQRRRTSIRMEHDMWDALAEICSREGVSVHALCTRLTEQQAPAQPAPRNFTSRLRVFILDYYRRGRDVASPARAQADRPGPP
ncbi:ribbon-helix-helix domain-containing protein [Zavarzinia sp. CC-PAN008]|uniref:ribbon-helix-helix domain-containing protein n=1 Tax=Zavarzinia sp. CC-PAN008 TaxID=3243332 RepID=UPI003F743F74